MNKTSGLILFLLFIVNILTAQNAEIKTPPSFQFDNNLELKPQTYKATLKENVIQLRSEDAERIKDGHPLRIAVGISANLKLDTESTRALSLPDGEKIWQQAIKSGGAEGLILSFSHFYIPEGGELYIYTEDRSQLKVYSNKTNPGGGTYATGILHQDEVILEYLGSDKTDELPHIEISNIGYVYRTKSALADDMTCYISINCSEGDNWQLQKNGVVGMEMSFRNGNRRDWYICTGSLINNVREDGTPFILTANHCIEGYDAETFSTMNFDFFKESTSTNCTTTSGTSSSTKTLTGATLIADIPLNGASDGSLLKLSDNIPDTWEVYYNGWDARDIAASNGVSIHHPNGMVKKVSTFTTALKPVGRINMGDGEYTGTNAHWEVTWAKTVNGQSVTYGGSSGSPIFNENGHIVGTLTGGSSYCDDPNEPDYYGRFSYHWDKYTDTNQHFKNYLDPDNTGTLVLSGYDPHAVNLDEVPKAIAATAITPTGFTANWDTLEKAKSYLLDVYKLDSNIEIEYVEGYQAKNVGNVTSYSISDLEYGTEYRYVIRGVAGSSVSEYSNEIKVKTADATFDFYTPVAIEASSIYNTSFTANWETLENATSYSLNVYQKEGGNNGNDIADFTGKLIPENWDSNISSYYESKSIGYYLTAPALRLDATGKYIETPQYDGNIKSIEFWYRGASTNADSYLTISISDGNTWSELKKIQPLNTSGVAVTIHEDEIPECTAVKFTYTKFFGNLALDDIKIVYGDDLQINYISGYEALNVGNNLSYKVTGLHPETQYYYSIIASDGSLFSKVSNEISIITNDEPSNIIETDISSYILVNDNYLTIRSNNSESTQMRIYNVAGQLILSDFILESEIHIPTKGFSKGMYFVQIGDDTHKILVR